MTEFNPTTEEKVYIDRIHAALHAETLQPYERRLLLIQYWVQLETIHQSQVGSFYITHEEDSIVRRPDIIPPYTEGQFWPTVEDLSIIEQIEASLLFRDRDNAHTLWLTLEAKYNRRLPFVYKGDGRLLYRPLTLDRSQKRN